MCFADNFWIYFHRISKCLPWFAMAFLKKLSWDIVVMKSLNGFSVFFIGCDVFEQIFIKVNL